MDNKGLGWDFFEGEESLKKDSEGVNELEKLQQTFAEVFSNPSGKKVLKILEDRTVNLSTLVYGGRDGAERTIGMSMREGENNLFRYIKNNVKNGEKLDG